MRVEYLIWSPDRATFLAVMQALANPLTQEPLASVEDGVLFPSRWVRVDEIGPVVKTPGTYDDDGTEITPPAIVGGHHVNAVAYGPLGEQMADGDPMANLLAMLGEMEWTQGQQGEFAGYVGTSGVKVTLGSAVGNRFRTWAHPG